MKIENSDTYAPKVILGKVLRWASPYWFSYLVLGFVIFLASLVPVGNAEGMRRLVNAVFERSLNDLWIAIGIIALVFVSELLLGVLRALLMQRLTNRTTLDLQREVLDRLFLTSLLKLGKTHTGDKIQRLNDSAVSAQDGINQKIPSLLEQILSVIFLFTYLVALSWELMAGAIVVAVLIPLLSNLMSKPIRHWQQKTNEAQAEQDSKLQDQMQGAEVVRSFGLRKAFNQSWEKKVDTTRRNSIKTHMWQASSGFSIFLGYWIGLIYILGLGAWMVMEERILVGAIAAFMISYERLVFPLSHLVNIWAAIQDALSHAERLFSMADPTDKKPAAEGREPLPNKGDLVMQQISFGYEEDKKILKSFSITFPYGRTTALVGSSGGGKSTVVKLLLGLYEPTAGEISFGGTRIDSSTLGSWRDRIAYVPQDTALFDGTILENIRIGRLDASEEEVRQAAQLAQADSFIQQLPEGYQTKIGERGLRLSGGERQRIAIARAYVRNPDILLLDEPTSALDGKNESLLQEALHKLMKDRTVIVVAHRLSTVRHADSIAVVENGNIVEVGNHDQLMAKNGHYAALVQAGEWMDQERGINHEQ